MISAYPHLPWMGWQLLWITLICRTSGAETIRVIWHNGEHFDIILTFSEYFFLFHMLFFYTEISDETGKVLSWCWVISLTMSGAVRPEVLHCNVVRRTALRPLSWAIVPYKLKHRDALRLLFHGNLTLRRSRILIQQILLKVQFSSRKRWVKFYK